MTPKIETARLVLLPYTRQVVAQTHVAWLNDPVLMRYSENRHLSHTLQSQYAYVDSFPSDSYFWLIRCGKDDIGTISARRNRTNHTANLGILMGDPLYRGSGYAAEAWQAVMAWLFEHGIRKCEAGCRADNWPMRRLAITSGMMLEAEIPGHFLTETGPVGAVFYGRFADESFKSEWETMWAKPFWRDNLGSS